MVSQIRDPIFHHLAIVSNNRKIEDRVSSIDVDAVYFKNNDPNVYNDKKVIDSEKLELLVANSRIDKLEDGSYHPQDLMAHKLKEHLEQENRKALTFLKKNDNKLDILFKHYEVVQSY